jgi:hypothetical protein
MEDSSVNRRMCRRPQARAQAEFMFEYQSDE